jgi:hypothetical protein
LLNNLEQLPGGRCESIEARLVSFASQGGGGAGG